MDDSGRGVTVGEGELTSPLSFIFSSSWRGVSKRVDAAWETGDERCMVHTILPAGFSLYGMLVFCERGSEDRVKHTADSG